MGGLRAGGGNRKGPSRDAIIANRQPIERQCLECRQAFIITSGEVEFFTRPGMELPKRCKPCRDKRREQREKEKEIGMAGNA